MCVCVCVCVCVCACVRVCTCVRIHDNHIALLTLQARSPETAPLVKLLDKIYCKLQAVNSLLPAAGINRSVLYVTSSSL